MVGRRKLISTAGWGAAATVALSGLGVRPAHADTYEGFLAAVRAEARRQGVSDGTLAAAFAGVGLNQKVLELFNHQPEFTLTWAEYRAKVVNENRIAIGRTVYAQNRRLLEQVRDRYGVDPGVILGIWGLESNFGATKGNYRVIEAL